MDDLRQILSPDDVYVTDELKRRPSAKVDYLREKLALQDLAQQMVDHPGDVPARLVDLALEMCEGTSARLSLFEASPAQGFFAGMIYGASSRSSRARRRLGDSVLAARVLT
jgi:hypothetical protein